MGKVVSAMKNCFDHEIVASALKNCCGQCHENEVSNMVYTLFYHYFYSLIIWPKGPLKQVEIKFKYRIHNILSILHF